MRDDEDDLIRCGDLPAPDTDDEQATLDFLRGVGHAGLTEVVGLYETVGNLERQLGSAITRAARARAVAAAHEAEQVAVIGRLQDAVARLSKSLAVARAAALPAPEAPDQDGSPGCEGQP